MPSYARQGGRPAFFEHGRGEALVLVPGIQGRWEWMRPAVEALARHFRVVTFSLLGEPGSGGRPPDRFSSYLTQVDDALAFARVERAMICGVSFGGLIAVTYAAERRHKASRLVLVSTPSPNWQPDERARRYGNAPRSTAVSFVAGAPGRLYREISAALPEHRQRIRALAGYVGSILQHPTTPKRMADRVKSVAGCDFVAEARRVEAPTLVITGEPPLDRVVPVHGTREYVALIRGAVGVTLERTGHIGLITRPDVFADTIYRWSRAE